MVVNKWRPWRKWVIMGFNSIISSKVVRKWKDENACWNLGSSQTITAMSIYKNVKAACSCLNSHAHAYRPCWSTDSQGHSVIMLFVKVSHDSSQCWQMAVCHVCAGWWLTDYTMPNMGMMPHALQWNEVTKKEMLAWYINDMIITT